MNWVRPMNIVTVADKGKYDEQALLLLQSINMWGPRDISLLVIVPNGRAIDSSIKSQMKREGAEVFERRLNPYEDPLVGKARAIELASSLFQASFLYLDSDTIVLNDFSPLLPEKNVDFAACTVGTKGLLASGSTGSGKTDEIWQAAFQVNGGLKREMWMTTEEHGQWRLYWNSGVLLFRNLDFAAHWSSTLTKMLENNIFAAEPYFTEQMSLSIAAHTFDGQFNYCNLVRQLNGWIRLPNLSILHYAGDSVLENGSSLLDALSDLEKANILKNLIEKNRAIKSHNTCLIE